MIRYPNITGRLFDELLFRNSRGSAAVEFAFVFPVFIMLLMGFLNFAQMIYAKDLLNGAVQYAARSATLEGANVTAADQIVRDMLRPVTPGVTVTSTRKNYFDFSDIGRPEKFTDNNGNGTCNPGEPYIDENGSGSWDADIGESGNGGANDAVVYTVTAIYTPVFKIPFMPAQWRQVTLKSQAVKKNQPFSSQAGYSTTATGTC